MNNLDDMNWNFHFGDRISIKVGKDNVGDFAKLLKSGLSQE